jgi:hypothetical protein
MIKAHRSHGAIMIWGLCNEAMCGVENGTAAANFMKVKNVLDPDRPQTANLVTGQHYNFPHLDIIGESGNAELNWWHRLLPAMPMTTGEHGFGNNELLYSRGDEDRQLVRLGANVSETFSGRLHNESAAPNAGWSNLKPKQTVPFLLSSHGLGMWAMTDYYGEAFMGWPTMIKSRGHLDVAGFPRATAWWFRTNFLANTDPAIPDYQRPLVGGNWDVQVRAMTPCQMFASTPRAAVWLDGKLHGVHNVSADYGLLDLRGGASWPPPGGGPTPCTIALVEQASQAACVRGTSFGCYDGIEGFWVDKGCRGVFDVDGVKNISCACEGSQGFCSTRGNCSATAACAATDVKNTTVVAIDAKGVAVGRHTLLVGGPAAKMEMVIDVPSKATGTGEHLYLDGQDCAFIRVQLVDATGAVSRVSDVNVTYAVVSGPIAIVGVGSGDIANHQPVQGAVYQTWMGFGRVVVQATVDCTGSHRELARQIDVEAGPDAYATACRTDDAVISATAGAFSATITIPVSGDAKHSPLAVAQATKSLDTYTYFDDVQA